MQVTLFVLTLWWLVVDRACIELAESHCVRAWPLLSIVHDSLSHVPMMHDGALDPVAIVINFRKYTGFAVRFAIKT